MSRCNGEAGARDAGKLRLEGKEYVVADGDVMHFRFNNYCVIIFVVCMLRRCCRNKDIAAEFLMSALIKRTRTVAIEFGMWRSGRKGGSSGSITFG